MTDEAVLQRLTAMEVELDRLASREAIRTAIIRFARGLDRVDRAMMESAFHADATVDMGNIYSGPVAGFLETTISNQKHQREVQHLNGNILIDLQGERATVESYELARHKSPMSQGETADLILAMRYLDRFERRSGEWRIAHRKKVMDWARIMTGTDGMFEGAPIDKGTRDATDASYAWLGWNAG